MFKKIGSIVLVVAIVLLVLFVGFLVYLKYFSFVPDKGGMEYEEPPGVTRQEDSSAAGDA